MGTPINNSSSNKNKHEDGSPLKSSAGSGPRRIASDGKLSISKVVINKTKKSVSRASALAKGVLKRGKKRKNTSESSSGQFEEVTIFSVNLDSSIPPGMDAPVSNGKSGNNIVVMLIDSFSTRFELIRLEFEPSLTLVKDVLNEVHSTEVHNDSLRNITYTSLFTSGGVVLNNDKRIKDYFPNNDGDIVVIAVPKGNNNQEFLKLATPILMNERVIRMLNILPKSIESLDKGVIEELSKENKTEVNEELGKDDKVEDNEEIGKYDKVEANEELGEEDKVENMSEKPESGTEEQSFPSITETESIPSLISVKGSSDEDDTKFEPKLKTRRFSVVSGFFLMLLFALASVYFMHKSLSSPLAPGEILLPGKWRNRCGVLHLMSDRISDCRSETLLLDQEGVLTLSNDNQAIWKMTSESDCAEECSAMVTDDGQFMIGNEVAFLIAGTFSPESTSSMFKVEVKTPKKKRKWRMRRN